MSYKPMKEMTDEELEREAAVWDAAVRDSQIREWVDYADRWRTKVRGVLGRRRQRAEGRRHG